MAKRSVADLKLVPITIPPLRQSTEGPLSCEVFYAESFIKGNKMPGGMESKRGREVHKVLADYASWCAVKQTSMDLAAFDRFALGAGPQAAKILVGLRDGYSVDWRNLLATEITMRLDANFRPTEVEEAIGGLVADSGNASVYEGTLDALYVFRDQSLIHIDDSKTHVRPFDPADPDKSLQGKLYSLFCLLHFPWAQKVKFRLLFVRYRNLTREVEYTRSDIPMLIETVKFRRAAQEKIHEKFARKEEMEATAGPHCSYCPLLSNGKCPIAPWNYHGTLTHEKRLNIALFCQQFVPANNKAMKEHVDATGKPIVVLDHNGKFYSYSAEAKESNKYPLFMKTENGIAVRCNSCFKTFDYVPEGGQCPECNGRVSAMMPIAELIEDYAYMMPDDTKWIGNLALSNTSFGSYLKAKDRAFLDQSIEDTADKVTKVSFKVSKPLDAMPIDDDESSEEESEWIG